ncbi:5906_t:CDS:2 [Funneliformis geosporum]|uniref:16301_t:CDS:1 n=1 Tax=Funneliformis geosporum TaxID=1117311 RepID=A0A9W4SWK7_9GLOM|nr:16301_t:CDS:2 [Funneliformis geosporum]CAI2183310.1 5906_t:CDS:2 [Funneliformis geosporum]
MDLVQDIPTEYFYPNFNQKDLTPEVGYYQPETSTFQSSFVEDFNFYPQQFDYTPSYGSPQSSFQESIESSPSLSDYEPSSDGYASCISSGISSPNLPTDTMYFEQERRNSFEYTSDFSQINQETYDIDAQFQQFGDLGVEPVPSLKLDTNIPPSNDQTAATDNFFSDSTFAHCLSVEPQPMFNLVPATPITPTKAAAIADSLFPYTIQLPPLQSTSVPNPDEQLPTTIRKSDSSLLRGRSHSTVSHRGHRKSLPSDMVERLYTMNLAPPKPARKSKTAAPFECPYEDCPKTFTRQYNLKSHLRTHTDERPFLCGYQGCMRAFARQHDRKRHYNLHLGFKPHVCSHCGRAFARLDALNRHLRSDGGAPCAQATLPNSGAKKFKPVNM